MDTAFTSRRSPKDDRGASLVETVVVLCVATLLVALALPLTRSTLDEGRARQAAAFAASRLRDVRQQAVARTAATGLVFDLADGRWIFRVCADGNANGLRRADLRAGADACTGDPVDLTRLFPGVSIDIDPAIPGPDDGAPSSDPVRFGAGDIASFSPAGSCTAGSLYLRSIGGAQYAVRVSGVTGRMRVLRYDAAAAVWREQ